MHDWKANHVEPSSSIHIEQRPPVEATLVRGLVKGTTDQQAVVQVTPNGIGSDEGHQWQQVIIAFLYQL